MQTIIFGGTFDPVHYGHLDIIEKLKSRFERVVVIPAGVPPFKNGSSAKDRLAMLRMSGVAEIDTLEIDSDSISYTYLTLEKYAKKTKDLYFCMGGDSLIGILKWKNPEKIMELAHLYVIPRPNALGIEQTAQFLRTMYGAKVTIADFEGENISGTEVRVRAAFDDFSLVPDNIAGYIKEKNLFSSYSRIAKNLSFYGNSPLRIEHTKNTALTAYRLAVRNSVNTERAVVAALLHDIGKTMTAREARERGYKLKHVSGVAAGVVHAYISEAIARKDFDITDADILNAIRYHATGRIGMSQLEKVVFLADLIEPGRNYEGVDSLRESIFTDMERGLIDAFEGLLMHLEKQDFDIDKNTELAYNYYKRELTI